MLTLGQDYELDRQGSLTRITHHDGQVEMFELFIDARGQKALTSEDLPFPGLRRTLLENGQDIPDVSQDYSLVRRGLTPAASVSRPFPI